jgi:hypothetical protein
MSLVACRLPYPHLKCKNPLVAGFVGNLERASPSNGDTLILLEPTGLFAVAMGCDILPITMIKSTFFSKFFLIAFASLLLCASDAFARDQKQVRAFKKLNPCPITGQSKGRCPGYEVDHINPLKCGGADKPSNMQWLTVKQHKAKTAREARLCRAARNYRSSVL